MTKKDFPDVIKVTNQLTTDMEVIQMDQPHHRTPLKTRSFLWLVAEGESERLEAWEGMNVKEAAVGMEGASEQGPENGL